MKLDKIYNANNIQCYKISNPSKEFVERYPKKIIYAFRVGETILFGNDDKIPILAVYLKLKGYMFTYNKVDLSKVFTNLPRRDDNPIPRICNMDQYFKDNDLVLMYTHLNKSPINFISDGIIMKADINKLLKVSDKELERMLERKIQATLQTFKSTEDWLNKLLKYVPVTEDGYPVRYPKEINDELIKKSEPIKLKNLLLKYDLRATDNTVEFKIAKKLERTHINPDYRITVHRDYNNMIDRIRNSSKNRVKSNDKLSIRYSDYSCINSVKYCLLDCL